jgi:hypothetical protein
MPVVSTTRYATAGVALDLARALMNDPNGVLWSDALLLPFLNASYRSLQEELATSGVSVMKTQADLDLPLTTLNGATIAPNPPQIGDDTDPALPSDCIVPYTLEERATGSSDLFVPMERITGTMPNFDPASRLWIWQWESDRIRLVGATQAVTVRIHYERSLPQLTRASDGLQIPNVTRPLAYEVAALAARSRGARELAMDMEQAAARSREAVLDRYTRAEQWKMRRRKPYGHRRPVSYF